MRVDSWLTDAGGSDRNFRKPFILFRLSARLYFLAEYGYVFNKYNNKYYLLQKYNINSKWINDNAIHDYIVLYFIVIKIKPFIY